MSIIESYRTVKGGIGIERLKQDLESQGCEILKIERGVMVPFCEGSDVLGDRITVRRLNKSERISKQS